MKKFKWLFLFLILGAAVLMQACGPKFKPEQSCNFVQDDFGQRVSWGEVLPVVIYIHDSVPSSFYQPIFDALDQWNKAMGREIFKLGGWTNQTNGPRRDGSNIIYYTQTPGVLKSDEQARTRIYMQGNQLVDTDVVINGANFSYSISDMPISGRVDLESLIVHELGHVLGLEHTIEPESVMVTSLPNATLRRELRGIDLDSIRCEY